MFRSYKVVMTRLTPRMAKAEIREFKEDPRRNNVFVLHLDEYTRVHIYVKKGWWWTWRLTKKS